MCDERPELLIGQPIGMYHCPSCGMMVVAGLAHPEPSEDNPDYVRGKNLGCLHRRVNSHAQPDD